MNIVKSKINRLTRTRIDLIDNRDGSFEAIDGQEDHTWATVCVDHGTYVMHGKRRVAESFMAVPDEWCEDCQTQVSTDGGGDWDAFADSWAD